MGTCLDNNTLLIEGSCSSNFCFYPCIAASEASNSVRWMCGSPAGGQPYAGLDCSDSTWILLAGN